MHDLEDRLETEIFRLQGIVASGERLGDELRRSIDLETNRVLSTLTIISSIFVPYARINGCIICSAAA